MLNKISGRKMDIRLDVNQSRKVYSVSELTRKIRFTLEDQFNRVWIEGEISNHTHHGSGHMYFSLKDATASIQCAMFRLDNARLRFKPENGMKVLCRGRVSVYAPRGQYQLIVEMIEPKGIGDLQIAFEQLKKKLSNEGLFDPARKKPIPFLPDRIGLITSLTGAVVRDFLHVAARRFPGAHVIICPVKVQGQDAKFEIVQALQDFNEQDWADVLVLARGGGSLEDLWPFNEESVARAITQSLIPVVSAVGHEVDYTIADFVSDLRAATPSIAAELLLPERRELLSEIRERLGVLDRSLFDKIETLKQDLLRLMEAKPFRSPLEFLSDHQQRLDEIFRTLKSGVSRSLELSLERLNTCLGRLEALSPFACLARGYGITFEHRTSKIIKSVKGLSNRQVIRTRFIDGTVVSRIEEVYQEKQNGMMGMRKES